MKRYLGIIVAVVFAIVAITVATGRYNDKVREADRAANAARINNAYLERVGWLRSNPDDKTYREEVTTFFRWYFNEVERHHKQFGGDREFDGYLEELEKRADKSKGTSVEDRKRYYEYTKSRLDLMKGGKYAPVFSATDKGMRLDVLSATPVTNAGQSQISYPIVLWGAQRELREETKNVKKMVTSASFNVTWKLYDEKGKLMGEMNAAGDPATKVDWPERFVPEFPPQMVLGHFDIDLLPAEAKTVEILFNVNSRSNTGGEIAANYVWKLEAPAEWKLRAGEAWKGAQESVRPADEIDPALAAKREGKQ